MPRYSVTMTGKLTIGQNKDLTPEQLDWRQNTVDKLVQELGASCIADAEMVARPRIGRVEILGNVEGKNRSMAADKVMMWEMMVEERLDVELFAVVEEVAEMEVVKVDG